MRNLRHIIDIQERATKRDPVSGAKVTAWETVFTRVHAHVTPLSGREFIAAHEKQAQVDTRIKIRYNPKINPTMRILFRDEIYHITAVLEDHKSGLHWITLNCTKGVEKDA